MAAAEYIKCPICFKLYGRRLTKHLREHGYANDEEFLRDFPGHPVETAAWSEARKKIAEKAKVRMSSVAERQRISAATKKAMARPDVRKKFEAAVCDKPLSDETKKKMSASISAALSNPEVKRKMYTEERNRKISEKKTQYWKDHPEKKARVGNMWKVQRNKDPEKWKSQLSKISQLGFEAAWGKKETSLETKYYSMLKREGISFLPQHLVGGKKFDAFIPSKNVLLEFDGSFWHPISLTECQYEWQVKNYHNDREKDAIARSHGIRLIRIREDAPISSIKTLLSDIYNK